MTLPLFSRASIIFFCPNKSLFLALKQFMFISGNSKYYFLTLHPKQHLCAKFHVKIFSRIRSMHMTSRQSTSTPLVDETTIVVGTMK